jgi:hypothetical protein
MDVGTIMLAEVVGFILTLCLFGLPLGIIGLFILSITDRWDERTVDGKRRPFFTDLKHVRWLDVGPIIDGVTARERGRDA